MDGQGSGALERWREQLEGWAIPAEILAAAPESPWSYPVGLFRSRARRAGSRPTTPSNREAARHLPEGGTVLDVGAGAGAASLPLARTAGRLVAVDESPEMLASFLAAAEAAELTDRHPLAGLRPLWRRFHDLDRPTGPGADDAVAALTAIGLAVDRQDWESQERFGFDDFDELVAFTRRRLCLPAARDPEVAEALLSEGTRQVDGVWVSGQPRRVTTLSWPGTAA
jgi:SAM-dependent methyltransferase